MRRISEENIKNALKGVVDRDRGKDIVTLGMVTGVQIQKNGDIFFAIEVDPQRGPQLEGLRQEAEKAVSALENAGKVTAVLTAEARPEEQAKTPPRQAPDPHGMNKNPRLSLPVRHIIAVASGKGGVGKSTVAANLAAAFAQNGFTTGLLDADIYGPSIPRMMGVAGQKPDIKDGVIEPLAAHGIKVMSIGFMVDDEAPLIWRGPMVQTAVYQMLRDVNWGSESSPLDVLIVDMPPGTGDVQLTMAQKVPITGAVIVSTPQDIALLDARKAIGMFEKTGVPVLGVIENMSTYICPSCGHEDHIFSHGGAEEEAKSAGTAFLGGVPLERSIRMRSDEGVPFVLEQGNASAAAFLDIARRLIDIVERSPRKKISK